MSLAAFVLRRLLWSVPIVLLVMLATFALMRGAGGSPFRPPEGIPGLPAPLQEELSDFYHLDEPWIVEFAYYVKNVFTLEFGPSLVNRYVSVDDVVENAFPVTGELILLSAAWAVPLGILLGLLAALQRSRLGDHLATASATVVLVVPVFFVTYVLSRYLVYEWDLFPLGWDGWRSKVLPVFALGLAPLGYTARLVRAAAVDTLQADYVRTARAKGLRRPRIVGLHVLRSSATPLLSAAPPMLALLVTGALFVEGAFGVPGVSNEFLQAARARDYPMIMGLTVALTVLVLGVNLVADVLAAALDPRLREDRR
ncbi:MAG TPA: ABC transporter permease [Gaiellaceae bacterium]|nr:ABC transporter permease [Gaiellaceae bacterium]